MKETLLQWLENMVPWIMVHGLKIILIAVAAYFIMRLVRRFIDPVIRKAVIPRRYADHESEVKRENTLIRIVTLFLRVVIAVVSGLMILSECGVPITPLLASAGVAGLAIGFGGQYVIRDLITGLFIIMENQYRVGDVVDFDGTGGVVEDITMRMTTLRDMDGTVHHVPHGEIKKVSNMTKNFQNINLDVTIDYDSDINHVIEVINRAGKEIAEAAPWKDMINKPPKFLRVDQFAQTGMVVKITGETKPLKLWDVAGELRKRIVSAFAKENIRISTTQQVVINQPNK